MVNNPRSELMNSNEFTHSNRYIAGANNLHALKSVIYVYSINSKLFIVRNTTTAISIGFIRIYYWLWRAVCRIYMSTRDISSRIIRLNRYFGSCLLLRFKFFFFLALLLKTLKKIRDLCHLFWSASTTAHIAIIVQNHCNIMSAVYM